MSEYVIVSARYANAEQTAAIIHTETFGDVAISPVDRPDLWQQMLEFGVIDPFIPDEQ